MKKTIIVGGAAGEGINTAARSIERTVKNEGLHFLSYRNYMSRVRGGYNYTTIVVGDSTLDGIMPKADLFLALDKEAADHALEMTHPGGDIYSTLPYENEISTHRIHIVGAEALSKTNNKNAVNMAGVGVALAYLGLDKSTLKHLEQSKWSDAINTANTEAAALGYECYNHEAKSEAPLEWQRHTAQDKTMMITGNQAVAMGAIAAGVSFYSAYPMAPSTGIMTFLSQYMKPTKMLVEQAEDEIAAIMAAIGASSNGVRAMTATSGGGFSLMVESLGFAAVAEVPLVLCNVQRPGPATGLPTRTEQADLMFMLHASQGEFARVLLAPESVADCFKQSFKAFNIADKYQVPVMLLTDQYLADSTQTIPFFSKEDLTVTRYLDKEITEDYKRYPFEDFIGTRKYPGIDSETLIMTDSHVHDVYGHVTEDADLTIKLKEKMLTKEKMIADEAPLPTLIGGKDYTHLLIAWGSTISVVREVVKMAREDNIKVSALGFTHIYPLSDSVLDEFVQDKPVVINIEGNATNQFGSLLKMTTGVKWHETINRYDGRPFTAIEVYQRLKEIYNEAK